MQKIVNSFVFGLLSVALLLSSSQVSFASSSILGTTGVQPQDIVVGNWGSVYTADYSSGYISRITQEGVSSIFEYLSRPIKMVKDQFGYIYTLDIARFQVWKINESGTETYVGVTAGDACDITVDGSGNVYMANSTQNKVAKLGLGGCLFYFR